MNLDLYDMFSKTFNREIGTNKLKVDSSKELLYKSLYLLEALIAEKPNSNNLNSVNMLYKDIKEFLTNNK
jgi:hypothetical protein